LSFYSFFIFILFLSSVTSFIHIFFSLERHALHAFICLMIHLVPQKVRVSPFRFQQHGKCSELVIFF
jgi:hypothetical protein